MAPDDVDSILDGLRQLVGPDALKVDSAALHIRLSALLSRLRAYARATNTETRLRKEATGAARHDMDQSYLGLQNLQYEKPHLEREIDKCRQFAFVSCYP
jgi:THO complex subunit 5